MNNLPSTACILPFVGVETTPLGNVRPCCLALYDVVDELGNKYNLTQHTLSDAFNSRYMQNMRQAMLDGEKPAACQRCWSEEDAGRQSKRISSRIKLAAIECTTVFSATDVTARFIDLKLGNICNLRCRICGSYSSSKWAQEEMDMYNNKDDKDSLQRFHLRAGAWPRNANSFWRNLEQHLSTIEFLEITGGEPFLIKEHFDLLERAIEQGVAKNISIHYNTNATTLPERAFEIWKHFKEVEIAFSIDAIGADFEYQRYPAKWETAVEIINTVHVAKSIYSNITTQVCYTISVHNVCSLGPLLAWIDQQPFDYTYMNVLHDPSEYNVSRQCQEVTDLIYAAVERTHFPTSLEHNKASLLNYIALDYSNPITKQQLADKISKLDQHRDQRFADYCPELAGVLGIG